MQEFSLFIIDLVLICGISFLARCALATGYHSTDGAVLGNGLMSLGIKGRDACFIDWVWYWKDASTM